MELVAPVDVWERSVHRVGGVSPGLSDVCIARSRVCVYMCVTAALAALGDRSPGQVKPPYQRMVSVCRRNVTGDDITVSWVCSHSGGGGIMAWGGGLAHLAARSQHASEVGMVLQWVRNTGVCD